MRLLYKNRESFLISFSSDLVFRGRSNIIQSYIINIHSILGIIDELYIPGLLVSSLYIKARSSNLILL
jgi:hypothetical protein